MAVHKERCPGRRRSLEAKAEESLVKFMRQNPEGGYLTKKTVSSYSREVQRLVDWCRKCPGGARRFSLASLAAVASEPREEDFDYPPVASEVLADVPSPHTGTQLSCAYIKVVDWLLHLLSVARTGRRLSPEQFVSRSGVLSRLRDSAKRLRFPLRKRQRQTRRRDRQQRQLAGLPPRSPESQKVKHLLASYTDSPLRLSILELLADLPELEDDDPRRQLSFDDGTRVLARPQLARDTLTLELLSSQGVRPDAILRSTLADFQSRRLVGGPPTEPGQETFYWTVPIHKSSDKHGEEVILASAQLVAAIEGYLEVIRGQLLGPLGAPTPLSAEDLSAPLFPSQGGGQQQRLSNSVEMFFRFSPGQCREPGTRPYVFRKLMAEFGLEAEDPAVRNLMPAALSHSEGVAKRHYCSADSKAKTKLRLALAYSKDVQASSRQAAQAAKKRPASPDAKPDITGSQSQPDNTQDHGTTQQTDTQSLGSPPTPLAKRLTNLAGRTNSFIDLRAFPPAVPSATAGGSSGQGSHPPRPRGSNPFGPRPLQTR
jgi:hypothetical protein